MNFNIGDIVIFKNIVYKDITMRITRLENTVVIGIECNLDGTAIYPETTHFISQYSIKRYDSVN